MIKGLVCFIVGHDYDWDKYYKKWAIEQNSKEEIKLYCFRCKRYRKLK